MVSDEDFSVNVYGIDRDLCLQWVPESKFDGQKAVMMEKNPPLEKKIAVARMNQNSGLYPGRQNRFNLMKIKIAVDENTFVLGSRGEVLLVDESCVWAWIPYASSDNLPVGAVVGGYDVEGLLYIARVFVDGSYSIGYYKPSKSLGYFVFGKEVRTYGVVEIFVIL